VIPDRNIVVASNLAFRTSSCSPHTDPDTNTKDRQHKNQMKTNKQLPIKQTSHIKLTIQQQELHSKHGVNSGASEE
jgi:hypothetical protein